MDKLIGRMSLKQMLLFASIVPMLAYTVTYGTKIWNSWVLADEARRQSGYLELMSLTSSLIRVTQAERGYSARYLDGLVDQATLDQKRSDTDLVLKDLRAYTVDHPVLKEAEGLYRNLEDDYKRLRGMVDRREADAMYGAYVDYVAKLIEIRPIYISNTKAAVLAENLRHLDQLERAKELGAQLSSHLAKLGGGKTDIPGDVIDKAISLKSRMELMIEQVSIGTKSEIIQELLLSGITSDQHIVLTELIQTVAGGQPIQEDGNQLYDLSDKTVNQITKSMVMGRAFTEEVAAEVSSTARKQLIMSSIFFAVFFGLMGVGLFLFVSRIDYQLGRLSVDLRRGVHYLTNCSFQIEGNGRSLNRSFKEQEDSIHKTSSATVQVNELIQSNQRSLAEAKGAVDETTRAVGEGKKTMGKMSEAMSGIEGANGEMIGTLRDVDSTVQEFAQMIEKIEQKTQVINEIVFQTKLLSFNASVEASRAGEHGKGFAVVAEEVGNLATLSGTSANEISELLALSTKTSQDMVAKIKSSVEQLSHTSERALQEGNDQVQACLGVFEVVDTEVGRAHQMMNIVTEAFEEQTKGMEDIKTAMENIQSLSQNSAQRVEQSIQSSADLNEQCTLIQTGVRRVDMLVHGDHAKPPGSYDGEGSGAKGLKQFGAEAPSPKLKPAPTKKAA